MIPKRYENAKFEDIPESVQELLKTMHQTYKGIYLHGPVGCGKTHILYAIRNKLEEKHTPFIFWNTARLLYEIRNEYRDSNFSYDTMGDLLKSPDILLLDDIGAEKLTDWVIETFYLLINQRYENMLPTIFTSNFQIKDLAERIGDRSTSRIMEMCDIVELDNKDRRFQ